MEKIKNNKKRKQWQITLESVLENEAPYNTAALMKHTEPQNL